LHDVFSFRPSHFLFFSAFFPFANAAYFPTDFPSATKVSPLERKISGGV
jgi:hypothetical protein